MLILPRRALSLGLVRFRVHADEHEWYSRQGYNKRFEQEFKNERINHEEENFVDRAKLAKQTLDLDPARQYSKRQLHLAYLKKVKEFHPDKVGGEKDAEFEAAQEAYNYLKEVGAYRHDRGKSSEEIKEYTCSTHPDRSKNNFRPIPEHMLKKLSEPRPGTPRYYAHRAARLPLELILDPMANRSEARSAEIMSKGMFGAMGHYMVKYTIWALVIWVNIEYIGYFIRWSIGSLNPDELPFHRWENLKFRLIQ